MNYYNLARSSEFATGHLIFIAVIESSFKKQKIIESDTWNVAKMAGFLFFVQMSNEKDDILVV